MNKELFGPALRQTTFMAALALLIVGSALLLLLNQPAEAQQDDKATSNLGLSSTNPGELVITWDAPSDAPDDYRVTWKKSTAKWPSYKNENTVQGGNAFPTGRSHTVTDLEEGTEYSVRVRARYHDGNGNVEQSGPWTATQEITVASAPLPAKPQNLLAAAMHNSVSLFWDNPNDDSITGYQILRGPDAANLTVLNNDTGTNSTSYTDDTVTAETTYVYAVLARNANGLSAQSDATTANTPAPPVEPESDLAIAGVDFTLDGKALDTTGTCSESNVGSISDDCTVNILIKSPVFAVDGTVDSDDRINIKTGRDKAAVDGASTSADESTLRGTDQTVVLTFPEGMSLLRLWGDEDGTAGGGEEHFFQVNVELAASIEAVKSPINEGEEEVQFRITLSDTAPSGGVDVMVELAPFAEYLYGQPVSVDDYKTHNVRIAQGQTEAILEILTTRDQTASNTKAVTATLLPNTGYTVGSNSEGTVSVNDPDQVNVRFADGCGQTITVGEGAGEASFDIVFDNPVAYTVSVVISFINGTASHGNDYTRPNRIVPFNNLQTKATVTVPILEDTQLENTESFKVWISRNGLGSNILTTTCGQSSPHLTIEITDNDTANIVLDAPEEVTEGDPIRLGLGPRPNVNCQVPFDFETTLTITGDTAQLQDSPTTSETLRLQTCGDPEHIKIKNDDSTNSDPVWQTVDRPGQQGDRRVTFTIGTLRSSEGPAEQLVPERMSATVTIKDKPNNEAAGSPIITGDLVVGDTLTVDTSGITDKDGLTNVEYTYRWFKRERRVAIVVEELSTASSYTVREQDIGDQIRLTVSFTDDVGYQEQRPAEPSDAVLPYLEHYFVISDKRLMEALSGTREVRTRVYLSDWPRIRSADGSRIHMWGTDLTPFTIPYTVSYQDGAMASWIEVQDVIFKATKQSPNVIGFQSNSNLTVTIKQISRGGDKQQVPYGEDLGKIVITLDDGIDLPNNGPKLNVREGSDTLTITIVSNGK